MSAPQQFFGSYTARAREFSQAPFWFWNDQLDEGEIVRQLDDFQAHGIHAFTLHPRAGLPRSIAWMSRALLDYMRFAIVEAARRGMWVILYDEGMYPSGSSAGQVVAENPAYACRGLVQVDLTAAAPGETVRGVRVGEAGVELTGQQTLVAVVERQRDRHRIAIVDRPIGAAIRGLHYVEDDPPRRDDHREVDENEPAAGDLLNPEAMRCFIRLVHQRYYEAFGDYFGETIKAIFTDEPALLGRGGSRGLDPRPGTTGILAHVNALLGYDFTPHLPALWDDAEPDALRHREAYHRAIRQRLEETYYRPVSAWCEAHRIALTGHPENSDDLGMLRHFQIPGQDVVLRYIEPAKESSVAGRHSTMAKCASSAMLHLGRRRNLNEFAGAYGHELAFEEYRWLALWLLVRGCNLLVPHAFYYSIRGPRVDERPRDVGPNSPWWPRYAGFADMTGKLCWLNTDSELVCGVAILGQPHRLPWSAARVCLEHQIDFNYLEDRHLGVDAVADEDGIRIASMRYACLIIEEGYGSTAGMKAEAALARLAAAGRTIAWCPAQGAYDLLQRIARVAPSPVSVAPACPGVRIRRIRKEGRGYLVVFNEGASPFHGCVRVKGVTSGMRVNMDTGKNAAWHAFEAFNLGPHDCMVLTWEEPNGRL